MTTRPRRPSLEIRPPVEQWVKLRVYVASAVITALFVGMGYKAYTVQVDGNSRYRKLARRQHLRTVEVPAPRGSIYDSTGAELAATADVDSVFANPRDIVDVAASAQTLAKLLDLDTRVVEAKLSSNRYFVWLKRHVHTDDANAVRNAKLPGVSMTREPRRFYPSQSLAGPLLGFSGVDGNGLEGMEASLDAQLAGKRATLTALRDARGRITLPADSEDHGATAGASVWLTIDRSIQVVCQRALIDAVTQHGARAGTVVALDVETSAVLAMANWPTYDPNTPAARKAMREGARNRAVQDAYELGSVMKIFSIAAALDSGAVVPTDVIDIERGRLRIGRKVFRDIHHDVVLTVAGVLKRSSNVGAIKIAQRTGKTVLHRALVQYGFGKKTGIEAPGERAGVVRPAAQWGETGLATISFGYGMTATPLQLAQAVAAVGNDGILSEPRLVKEVRDATGTVVYRRTTRSRRVMKPETAAAMRAMMAAVFDKGKTGGTAKSVDVLGFRAGGKTGTAEKWDSRARSYNKDLNLASFVGLAPIDDPKIALVVIIDEPQGERRQGGAVAGPVFARIASETLRHLAVPGQAIPDVEPESAGPSIDEVADASEAPAISDGDEPEAVDDAHDAHGPRIPSFAGLGARRAISLAKAHGLDVQVQGSGRVIEQFPLPGPARDARQVRLVLAQSAL